MTTNTMKTNTKSLAGLLALTFVTAIQAASIEFAVKVPGYPAAGWITVKPELRNMLGGRVAYLPQFGGWVTDRASRLEPIRTTILPNRAAERPGSLATISLKSNGANLIPTFRAPIPLVNSDFKVSGDPKVDNITVSAVTAAGTFEQRVPVGTRPR